ncbi:MFS transporter [Christensenellaceae bacterium OttesenSCG-928-L17]|nr:MFS transporter [Christensenellaceae bacterium OttesenSCG-928-L17]
MKLNYKRTMLVGLAFLSISAFWQLYDQLVPLILRDTFALGDTLAGFIMSLDNILALFLLPLFGALSDRAGKRMPFILCGTALAAALMVLLPLADRAQSLAGFFVVLALLLVSMGLYRSPAVALMPDVTPKPLRSKANAVINLMGTLGGIFTLGAVRFFVVTPDDGSRIDYLPVFLVVAALMVLAVIGLRLTVNEKKLKAEMQETYPEPVETEEKDAPGGKLEKDVRRSLILILCSVSLWFMGYNAVTTAYSKYVTSVWGQTVESATTCLLIATVGAVVSYLPIGFLSTKIGRKKTIMLGVGLLAVCFFICSFATANFSMAMYLIFAIIGFAWAAINVNSYPMVVEISRSGNVGKYTGYYYTFSMAAQIVTPIVSGALLEHVGYHTLFPYAAAMVALAAVTMAFTRHGDNKPAPKKSKLEAFDVDD